LTRQKVEKEEEAEQIRNTDHEAEEERKRWFSTDRDDEPDATLKEPSSGWKGKDLKVIVKVIRIQVTCEGQLFLNYFVGCKLYSATRTRI